MSRWSRYGVLFVLGSALALGLLLEVPQFLYQRDPRAQGIPVHLNSDEYVYLARVEEALSGRPEQSAEAIIGDPRVRGTQPALLERAVGTVFSFTGWRAAAVLQWMDAVTGFLIFLSLFWFLRRCGFSSSSSYIATVAFSLIELYNLNRPIHQGLSTVIVLLALSCVIAGLESRIILGIVGGLLLGMLFGVYYWSWSFAWIWFVLLFLRTLYLWLRGKHVERFRRLLIILGVALLTALPFVAYLISLTRDPLYTEAIFRSGMHPSYFPESWPYSALFLVMLLGTLFTMRSHRTLLDQHAYAVITVLTAFIAIHQQFLHGIVFNFVSHYLLLLVIAAITAILLWFAAGRRPTLSLAAIAACIYLAGIAYDGRSVIRQFRVYDRFSEQHFSTLLPVLDDLSRSTVLSDPSTSMFIAGATKHDVVYSVYLKNVLISNEEIAKRYCLTQLPTPPNKRDLKNTQAIYPDADSAFPHDPSVRRREREMIETACAEVDRRPFEAMQAFHAQYVVWDQRRHPEWDLRRLKVRLRELKSGSGWTLYSL